MRIPELSDFETEHISLVLRRIVNETVQIEATPFFNRISVKPATRGRNAVGKAVIEEIGFVICES